MFQLPTELLTNVARQLDVRSRLALGATCKAASAIVVDVAIFEFRFSSRVDATFATYKALAGHHLASLQKLRMSKNQDVALATPAARKKGHVMPIYEALEPDAYAEDIHCTTSLQRNEDDGVTLNERRTSSNVGCPLDLRSGSVMASNGQATPTTCSRSGLIPK